MDPRGQKTRWGGLRSVAGPLRGFWEAGWWKKEQHTPRNKDSVGPMDLLCKYIREATGKALGGSVPIEVISMASKASTSNPDWSLQPSPKPTIRWASLVNSHHRPVGQAGHGYQEGPLTRWRWLWLPVGLERQYNSNAKRLSCLKPQSARFNPPHHKSQS